MDPRERIEALAHDRSHGASEIADAALEAMASLAESADDPATALADAGARLVEAHPAMAPLVHLADDVLRSYEAEGAKGFDRLAYARDDRARRLAHRGADLVEPGDQVATYSRSGTVLSALLAAAKQGVRFGVLVSEARPGLEGLTVASDLADAGVPVTLTTDAGLGDIVRDADRLLVGADSICARGLVNKIGTGTVLREAERAGVPGYVLAGTDKLMPASFRKRPPLAAAASMDHDLPEGVREAAPLFECRPLDPVERVVTEADTWTPEEVLDRLASIELHPALADRF